MRFDGTDPSSLQYLNHEPLLNRIKRISVNGGTDRVWGVGLVDSNGNLLEPASVHTGISDNRLTVTTAGTEVQFTALACKKVTIVAETDNTSYVVVGGSTVVAALATRRGVPLGAGDSVTFEINNMNLLYLDSLVDGEGVTFVAET